MVSRESGVTKTGQAQEADCEREGLGERRELADGHRLGRQCNLKSASLKPYCDEAQR